MVPQVLSEVASQLDVIWEQLLGYLTNSPGDTNWEMVTYGDLRRKYREDLPSGHLAVCYKMIIFHSWVT